jgi:hypothetical protein
MARIVVGLGTSHSPQLSIPADAWRQRGEEDRRNQSLYRVADGRHVSFDELLAEADPGVMKELEPGVMARRDAQNQKGIQKVADALAEADPDVLVVIGDDQNEAFHEDNMPAFSVYWGDTVPYYPRNRTVGTQTLTQQYYPTEPQQYPGQPELALHIIDSMMDQGFDVAHSKYYQEGQSIAHAVSFVHARIMRKVVPVVPIPQNTYFPPNQPRPKRAFDFGLALRNAIETWKSNARVGIVASGGLSHFVVDEDIDQRCIKAMKECDASAIAKLPLERLNSGTSEVRNWFSVAGACHHLGMEMFDYVPCYRSPAGTGCAMAFARWV